MAKKRIFTNRSRRRETFLGGRRKDLSFPELEETTSSVDGLSRRMKKVLPSSAYNRFQKIKGIHVVLGMVFVVVAVLLVWFFFFVYPSPIGALLPAPNGFTRNPNVDICASIGRALKPGELSLEVDGKDVTPQVSLNKKGISCRLALVDGPHKVNLELKGGGLMGKRSANWSFSVDTTPPTVTVTNKKISEVKGSDLVRVQFSGVAEEGSRVEVKGKPVQVDAGGKLKGTATSARSRSLKVTATDSAGNQSATYIVTQKIPDAKGAHVSIFMAASDSDMGKLIGLVERTELNALEVDLKDEAGQIGFELDNPLAKQVNSTNDYINLEGCVDKLRFRDIYTICRIVVFKDPKLASGRPDLVVQDKYGGPWSKGVWMDPYSSEVWDYNLSVAIAAAKAGFNEVQFDYVRFPSDGNTTTCLYPKQDGRTPGQVIDGFLNYARDKLAPYNVFISADVFGLTASKQGEMGIGQRVQDLARGVDYLSPMVYPSHYNAGEYNIKDPEANPFDTVSRSMADFKKVTTGTPARLRPWIQDFSLRVTYTPDMVRRQIDAVEQGGAKEWLLWDPECTYSESALKPQEK